MAFGPCTPTGKFTLTRPVPGGGYVTAEVTFTHDGVSQRSDLPYGCDGDITEIHTQNTGSVTMWALLPDKKKAPPYVEIPPGTDIVTTAPGQLNNLGLTKASDAKAVTITDVDPSA